jgi:hypothetical protein
MTDTHIPEGLRPNYSATVDHLQVMTPDPTLRDVMTKLQEIIDLLRNQPNTIPYAPPYSPYTPSPWTPYGQPKRYCGSCGRDLDIMFACGSILCEHQFVGGGNYPYLGGGSSGGVGGCVDA